MSKFEKLINIARAMKLQNVPIFLQNPFFGQQIKLKTPLCILHLAVMYLINNYNTYTLIGICSHGFFFFFVSCLKEEDESSLPSPPPDPLSKVRQLGCANFAKS